MNNILPKAPLFNITLPHGKWMLARFRNANAHQIFIGPFSICIRAPWLDHVARQLYPHLFKTKRPVAFRVVRPDDNPGFSLFHDEELAASEAEMCGGSYQGLYVRDGT